MTVLAGAAGPEQIRAGFTDAAAATGEHAAQLAGLATGLAEAADWYTTLNMAGTTVEQLRQATGCLNAARRDLSTTGEHLQAALDDFNARDGRVSDAVTETGNLMDPGEAIPLGTPPGTLTSTDRSDSMATSPTSTGTEPGEGPDSRNERDRPARGGKPTRITGDEADVLVTSSAGTVRIDLTDYADDPEFDSPHVVLDEAGAAALAEAAEAMQAAEQQGQTAYRKLDAKIRRWERRREQIEEQRRAGHGAEFVALEDELEDLASRGDRLRATMRERLELLSPDDRAAYDALEAQLTPDGDRRAIRAAQQRIVFAMTDAEISELYTRGTPLERRRELLARPGGLPDGGFGRRSLYLRDQAEMDKVAARTAELRRQAEALPLVPLSPRAEAELAQMKADIAAAESTMGDMTDWQALAEGVIPTTDGAGLAWQTVMTDGGEVRHHLDRRPADANADWYVGADGEIPRLTSNQLRQLVRAVTGR
jgi:hypothetical protein